MENINEHLKSHETSTKHIESVISFGRSSTAASRVDVDLHKNVIEQHHNNGTYRTRRNNCLSF